MTRLAVPAAAGHRPNRPLPVRAYGLEGTGSGLGRRPIQVGNIAYVVGSRSGPGKSALDAPAAGRRSTLKWRVGLTGCNGSGVETLPTRVTPYCRGRAESGHCSVMQPNRLPQFGTVRCVTWQPALVGAVAVLRADDPAKSALTAVVARSGPRRIPPKPRLAAKNLPQGRHLSRVPPPFNAAPDRSQNLESGPASQAAPPALEMRRAGAPEVRECLGTVRAAARQAVAGLFDPVQRAGDAGLSGSPPPAFRTCPLR